MVKRKRKRGYTYLYMIAAMLAVSSAGYAQDSTHFLSLDEAINAAVKENKNLMQAQMDEKVAASAYKQTDAIFLPQVNFSYAAYTSNNPLNAFGFKLQQKDVQQQDFNPAILNNPGATPDFATGLMVQQPIINMDMLYMRKSAAKQTEVYQLKTQRTREYITLMVQQAYLQLQLAYNAKKVFKQALLTAQATYKFTSDRYQQGLLQKYDVLNVSVQIKSIETSIEETNSNIGTASDYLSALMNKPQGTVYTAEDIAVIEDRTQADTLPAARADFKATEAALQSYNLMIKSSRMGYLPKLNAFANYQLHDKSMFGFGANAYMAGIQLSWDIFKGFQNKNKINTQVLQRDKLALQLDEQKDEATTELNKTRRQVNDAAYKMQQQQEAIDQASEALRILQNRYNQGLVNTTDVLMAQTQLSQQQLGYAQAVFARNTALVYLQYLTTSINK
ncbi:MAG TPA: TolC family protein [Chitinophagaceae bacterium]|nr:TolC family protein [Chitinophagaceae bacterium]